jgi:hypothetical protein
MERRRRKKYSFFLGVHSSIVISPSHFLLSLLLSLLWTFVFSIYFFSLSLSGFVDLHICFIIVNFYFHYLILISTGLDGLSVEFYRKFWNTCSLKKRVSKVFNFNYERGHLSNSQKIGAISLIFQKKDSLSLDNLHHFISVCIVRIHLINELLKPNCSRHSVINDHSKESNAFVKSRNNK